jgi:hypothetical protein
VLEIEETDGESVCEGCDRFEGGSFVYYLVQFIDREITERIRKKTSE